jgi:Xaa-Pro aminopeptidase
VRSIVCEPLVASGLVEELRLVKDAHELAVLERACSITAAALESLASTIAVGDTEVAVARRLEQLFGELGADDRAFATIVATGDHSAIPHHRPTRAALREGDLLVIDAGAKVAGYHADMTRTFVVGAGPDPWQVELHSAVHEAQRRARASCEVGIEARTVDEAARAALGEWGLEDRFTHGLGHGVGLVIHEAPALGPRATGTIRGNMAFTVEPGAYLPGRGGVRIEDTLVATDAGPRVLTESSRELRVVGV